MQSVEIPAPSGYLGIGTVVAIKQKKKHIYCNTGTTLNIKIYGFVIKPSYQIFHPALFNILTLIKT